MSIIQTSSEFGRTDDVSNPEQPPSEGSLDAQTDVEVMRSIPPAFVIDSAARANWLVRKVIEARRYAARVKIWAEQEQRRAEREERTLMYMFGRQLEEWAKDEIANSKRRLKSVNLPAGRVGFQKVNLCLRVDDESAVIRWAMTNCPAAVNTVTLNKLARNELKAHFEATGEVPEEGVRIDPGGERFFVREGRSANSDGESEGV